MLDSEGSVQISQKDFNFFLGIVKYVVYMYCTYCTVQIKYYNKMCIYKIGTKKVHVSTGYNVGTRHNAGTKYNVGTRYKKCQNLTN